MVDQSKTRDDMIQLAAIALREFHNAHAADLVMSVCPERQWPNEPAIAEGNKIAWIKWHRARFGSDLKAAKDAADAAFERAGV
jgi:ribosomal protein L7/L12